MQISRVTIAPGAGNTNSASGECSLRHTTSKQIFVVWLPDGNWEGSLVGSYKGITS